jgi:integrase
VWDPDNVVTFFGLIADDPLLPLWRLVTLCGLRRGEVAGLWGDDFDFTDGYVRVTRQLHVNGPSRCQRCLDQLCAFRLANGRRNLLRVRCRAAPRRSRRRVGGHLSGTTAEHPHTRGGK